MQAGKPFGCCIGVEMNNKWEEGIRVIFLNAISMYKQSEVTTITDPNTELTFAQLGPDLGPVNLDCYHGHRQNLFGGGSMLYAGGGTEFSVTQLVSQLNIFIYLLDLVGAAALPCLPWLRT